MAFDPQDVNALELIVICYWRSPNNSRVRMWLSCDHGIMIITHIYRLETQERMSEVVGSVWKMHCGSRSANLKYFVSTFIMNPPTKQLVFDVLKLHHDGVNHYSIKGEDKSVNPSTNLNDFFALAWTPLCRLPAYIFLEMAETLGRKLLTDIDVVIDNSFISMIWTTFKNVIED